MVVCINSRFVATHYIYGRVSGLSIPDAHYLSEFK